MIPYGRQSIDDADVEAVVAVLRSDWLTQGPSIEAFEQAVAAHCQAEAAVAFCNATAALHVACRALDLGPGDRLWTSPNTFVASANCALYCGATVDFVDIDPVTRNMSVAALSAKLAQARTDGALPQVVVPVHFGGLPCDMQAIAALATEYGFRVLEDASHAIGAEYLGVPVGACTHSDMTVFSFHPVKIITSGEGGMILTRDPALAARARLLRSHGITRDEERMTGPSEGPWYYQQVELGWNYRMTDLQAALGVSQLRRLDEFVARRAMLADRYDELLSDLPLQLPARLPAASSAWHLYPIRLDDPDRRRQVFDGLRKDGVGVNVHYIPVHLQPYYRALGFAPGDFPEAEAYYAGAISLPLFYGLSGTDQDIVVSSLSAALQ